MANEKISQLPPMTGRDQGEMFPESGGSPFATYRQNLIDLVGNYSSYVSGATSHALPDVTTSGLNITGLIATVATGGFMYPYLGTGGTAASNAPLTILPTDYNATSNQQYYQLLNLPVQCLNGGTGASSTTFWRGDGTWATPPGAVASITGTANQIAVSAPTGAVTLSIPSTFVAPGSITATTTLASGGNATFGPGGTSAGTTFVRANGASATASGAIFAVQSNGTDKSYFGIYSAVTGGGTDNSAAFQSVSDNMYFLINAAKTYHFQVNLNDAMTLTAAGLNLPGTTSASSPITGTLTIGNGTAATNVGIGGGSVWAGGNVVTGYGGGGSTKNGYYFYNGTTQYWGLVNDPTNSSALTLTNDSPSTVLTMTQTGTMSILANNNSVGSTSGTLIVGNGTASTTVGIGGGNIFAGGTGAFRGTTASTSTTTGAVVISGGVGIAGALYVGGAINVGSTSATSLTIDPLTGSSNGTISLYGRSSGTQTGLSEVYADQSGKLVLYTGAAALTLDRSQNATFAGTVSSSTFTSAAGVTLSAATSNGVTINGGISSGTGPVTSLGSSQTLNASSGTQIGTQITYTLNQTSTGGCIDLYINRTQTAAGSGVQYLFAAAVGSVGKFTVDNSGNTVISATTAASSTTTGALVVGGGVGIAGALWVGGSINSAITGNNLLFNALATNSGYITWNGTGGTAYLGQESSTGGGIITGSAAYGFSISSAVSRNLYLGTNGGTNVLMLDTASNATFAGGITLGTALATAYGGTGATTVKAANQNLTPATTTITESTGAAAVDWSQGNAFYLALNANCTITFSNAVDGQVITVTVLNTASNYTVTWPTIKWPAATAPVQTVGAHYDVYTFVYNSGLSSYFGNAVQNF